MRDLTGDLAAGTDVARLYRRELLYLRAGADVRRPRYPARGHLRPGADVDASVSCVEHNALLDLGACCHDTCSACNPCAWRVGATVRGSLQSKRVFKYLDDVPEVCRHAAGRPRVGRLVYLHLLYVDLRAGPDALCEVLHV